MRYPMIDKKATGKRIKECMDIRGVTVLDVQEYLNLATPQAVYHWLNGRSLPSIDNLYALSEYLRVPMDSLVCGNRWTQRVECHMAALTGMGWIIDGHALFA